MSSHKRNTIHEYIPFSLTARTVALDYQRMLMWGCVSGSINLNAAMILDIIMVIVLALSVTRLSISLQRWGTRDTLRVNIHDVS